MDIVIAIITGGIGAAAIKIIDNIIAWKLARKGKQLDQRTEKECETDKAIIAVQEGVRVMLLDRILYLGQCYIHEREVDLNDRIRLSAMHRAYKSLGGNGDADAIMACVNSLPLK